MLPSNSDDFQQLFPFGALAINRLSYYFYKNQLQTMNNFNPFNNMYCQFWVLPNYVQPRTTYFAPVVFYPQIIGAPQSNLIIQNVVQSPAPSLPPHQQKIEQKAPPKPIHPSPAQKHEPEKVTVNSETNLSKSDDKKNQCRVANRPQTYLTEKAYYMKQKLKGKQKTGIRILRRRIKCKQEKPNKIFESEKVEKKQTEMIKSAKKMLPIAKDSQKERKIVHKIKIKLSRQNLNECAQIPKLIFGLTQLNNFCKQKLQSLALRQFKEA